MFFRGRGLLRTAPICKALAGMASAQDRSVFSRVRGGRAPMSEAVSEKIDGHTAGRSQSTTDRCAIGVGLLLDVIPKSYSSRPFQVQPNYKSTSRRPSAGCQ
jgi:hypothetical protein